LNFADRFLTATPEIDCKIVPPKPEPILATPHTDAVALNGTTSAGKARLF